MNALIYHSLNEQAGPPEMCLLTFPGRETTNCEQQISVPLIEVPPPRLKFRPSRTKVVDDIPLTLDESIFGKLTLH